VKKKALVIDNMPGNNLGKIPHELKLVLACASGHIEKIHDLLLDSVNWDMFLQLALHHRVYPLVYDMLSQLSQATIPENILIYLQKVCKDNVLNGLQMAAETVRIINRLEDQGIHVLILKGLPLASRLYNDIALRPSKDIDILVSPSDLNKAHNLLQKDGYREIDNPYPQHSFTSKQSKVVEKFLEHAAHVGYWHDMKSINVELHWSLGRGKRELPFPNENDISKIDVAGYSLPVLRDEIWLNYLILHGVEHAWFRLRWLVDIAKFIERNDIDWEKVFSMAESKGVETLLLQSLILASELLNTPVPDKLQSALASDRAAWRLAHLTLKVCIATQEYEIKDSNGLKLSFWKNIYKIYLLKGWRNRFIYILEDFKKLFSPSIYDFMTISLPDRFFGLYYILHPFCFLYRRFKKTV